MADTPRFPANFDETPFLVIWEVTRACALACVHCRAEAVPCRDPRELTTEEGIDLIDQVAQFGVPRPLFVLTGGDPMRRPDLTTLVRHAADAGLTVALTPSGTAACTRARLAALMDAGLSRVAVSLDGPDADAHDAFRRVKGSYAWTQRIIDATVALGLPLQINTTISRMTLPHLERMAALMGELPVTLWAVFFLVQTGRGATLDQVSPHEAERVLQFLYDLSLTASFGIKTTEAPHYHRVCWQQDRARADARLASPANGRRRQLRAPRNVGDGNGFVFIDHVGNICPSGFLPVPRGNVKDRARLGPGQGCLVEVYRRDDVFRRLRNPNELHGKCGRCEFRAICGGSRSRAFAATGALMASDGLCAYDPGPVVRPLVDGGGASGQR
jgi:radical SAM protein